MRSGTFPWCRNCSIRPKANRQAGGSAPRLVDSTMRGARLERPAAALPFPPAVLFHRAVHGDPRPAVEHQATGARQPPAAGAGRDEHLAQTQSAGLPDGLLRPVQPGPVHHCGLQQSLLQPAARPAARAEPDPAVPDPVRRAVPPRHPGAPGDPRAALRTLRALPADGAGLRSRLLHGRTDAAGQLHRQPWRTRPGYLRLLQPGDPDHRGLRRHPGDQPAGAPAGRQRRSDRGPVHRPRRGPQPDPDERQRGGLIIKLG